MTCWKRSRRTFTRRPLNFRTENTHRVDTWDELVDVLENKGGFALAHWDGTGESEDRIKETKATIRCLLLDAEQEEGNALSAENPPNSGL